MLRRIEGEPFPKMLRLFGFAILFVVALALFTNAAHPRQTDFVSFWAAGKLTLAGNPVASYDIQAHKAVQLTLGRFDRLMPFPYPPPFLLLVTPFALLPFGLAAILWVTGTFTLYVAAARKIAGQVGWLAAAFPPVLVNGIIGQNGFLTAAIFMWGLSQLDRRPFASGLLLGCLIIKPQLAVLVPLAFASGGNWRAFAGAAASSVGLAAGSLIIFGPQSYIALAKLMPLYSSVAADGLVGWHKMASVYASLRLLGLPASVSWAGHIAAALFGAACVWKVWRSDAELLAKAAVLVVASMLISPYLYLYDTPVLLVPFLWLLRNGEDPRRLALLWCIPLIVALQNWGLNQLINPAPLLPLLLLLLIKRRLALEAASGRPSRLELAAA